ncbi:MAG: phosphotransferase, partial [Myxococcota bacterium]
MNATASLAQARSALRRWDLGSAGPQPSLQPLKSGVNQTFRVTSQSNCYALQQLSPSLSPRLHQDVQVVTEHLYRKGLTTPRLVPTPSGELFACVDDRPWRLLTWIDGVTHHTVATPAMAHAAGRLVAIFHVTLADLRHAYHVDAAWVHDAQAHFRQLRRAMVERTDHPLHAEVAPLADSVFDMARELPDFGRLPHRHSHGDLKISNVVFARQKRLEEGNRALALIDLDTLGPLPWPLELGDALRSWCNPAGEECARTRFDPTLCAAALQGYARELPAGFLQREEIESLVPGLLRVP